MGTGLERPLCPIFTPPWGSLCGGPASLLVFAFHAAPPRPRMTPAASLLLGALLGAANAAAAVWTARRAGALEPARGMQLVLGGMAVRMMLALAAVALVLALVDVHRVAFVGGVGLLFAVGLAVEIALLVSRPAAPPSA